MKFQKPIVKWVGGKTQLIDKITDLIPKNIHTYHEIFLGGGSVLLAVLTLQKHEHISLKHVLASDINEGLINMYLRIQNNPQELYTLLSSYWNIYDSIKGTTVTRKPQNDDDAKTSKESYYFWVRQLYNSSSKNTIDAAAMFIFLNKTCFRGLFREGPRGFNVPYGHYKKTPQLISEDELNNFSNLIKDVKFKHCSFSDSIPLAKKNDFVYLDPPYAPENSKSFVKYNADGFNEECHQKLFDEILQLDKRKVKFLMSNSKVDLVTDAFLNFNISEVSAKRAINSKNPASKTFEILVSN